MTLDSSHATLGEFPQLCKRRGSVYIWNALIKVPFPESIHNGRRSSGLALPELQPLPPLHLLGWISMEHHHRLITWTTGLGRGQHVLCPYIWEFGETLSLHPFPCAAFNSPSTLPISLPPVWTTYRPTMGPPEWPSKTQFWPGHCLSCTLQSLPRALRMQAKIHSLAETALDCLLLLLFSISLCPFPPWAWGSPYTSLSVIHCRNTDSVLTPALHLQGPLCQGGSFPLHSHRHTATWPTSALGLFPLPSKAFLPLCSEPTVFTSITSLNPITLKCNSMSLLFQLDACFPP